jgi:hypothetical protein
MVAGVALSDVLADRHAPMGQLAWTLDIEMVTAARPGGLVIELALAA